MAEQWERKQLEPKMQALIERGLLPSNARMWERSAPDGTLRVIRTVEPQDGKWCVHLSISHRGLDDLPGRYPTWDEQKEACWTFADGKSMVSYMPAKGAPYVNHHETTFHWWEVPAWE